MDSPRLASAALRLRHVFLRDMVLPASIGVHPHEHAAPQRIRINVDLAVTDDAAATPRPRDDLSQVVDYETIAASIRAIVAAGHVRLVETLAERLARSCLADPRIRSVRIRVEKLDIFADTAAVGVEIERTADE